MSSNQNLNPDNYYRNFKLWPQMETQTNGNLYYPSIFYALDDSPLITVMTPDIGDIEGTFGNTVSDVGEFMNEYRIPISKMGVTPYKEYDPQNPENAYYYIEINKDLLKESLGISLQEWACWLFFVAVNWMYLEKKYGKEYEDYKKHKYRCY